MEINNQSAADDEFYMTAHHIFDYCGADSTSFIRVDDLMEKFSPFVKADRAEFKHLKSLLDPRQENPNINVSSLAEALSKYSECQKVKVDLDESFNLKGCQGPLDSDSGISSDGFQLLEELQCELREKSHLAHQLRSQLDFTDRQHEEAISSLTAERDSLRAHLNMLREENITLTHVKSDYEETCDRLCSSERALEQARRELEAARRKCKLLTEQAKEMETEKLTLQELLATSKAECHRINEMYSSRQAALLDEVETLRSESAVLSARLHDQEDYMHHTFKEKALLEMELKDILNKSNQQHLRMDQSIDVSYTEDQMLTALDSLNADSRFSQDGHILDEESFAIALKEGHGPGRMSLFDEMRLSFSNMSKHNDIFDNECKNCKNTSNTSLTTIGIQTDEGFNENAPYANNNNVDFCNDCSKAKKDNATQTETTNLELKSLVINDQFCSNCKKLESDLTVTHNTITEMQGELEKYEANLNVLQNCISKESEQNNFHKMVVDRLKNNIAVLEAACAEQKDKIDRLGRETSYAAVQTEYDVASTSVQVDTPCGECVKRNAAEPSHPLRRYFWEPLKSLFQLFAVICFICAISLLYGVTRKWHTKCLRDSVPWSWLNVHEIMDLFFRLEYVADVPM